MARGRPSKKAQIIQAACELFIKQGYQGTSIDQVVAAAAVSKPTVYSNFTTKLLLWESVLVEIIQRAEQELTETLKQLEQTSADNPATGWIALWKVWCQQPERIATYRILLGEQYKMQPSTVELFNQLEQVLENHLLAWMKAAKPSDNMLFSLNAVSKEALLMPALLNQDALPEEALHSLISQTLLVAQ